MIHLLLTALSATVVCMFLSYIAYQSGDTEAYKQANHGTVLSMTVAIVSAAAAIVEKLV